jgi:uncharacterized lipoprotein YddW (UPF0748 family)
MNCKLIVLILFVLTLLPVAGQETSPKREFRGAWIALVNNEDWPSQPGLSTEQQQYELRVLLDELQANNINAVIFQIRPECDAIYQSAFDPWSYWLTGEQGQAPDPFYDPLQFAIDEAHKRGMELHAWFNPYRAERTIANYPIAENHITQTHPDWVISINTFKFLNPGLPEVRQYVLDVIMDVADHYAVDGIHLDDYFYPYPPNQIENQDASTFNSYPRDFSDIADWRRDNVHLLVKKISDTLAATYPSLKFGISPFGIWKNGVPEGIVGLDAYNDIFCDAVTWIENQWLDYLIPQLYWPFGGNQDYGTLLPWWASQINGRHLYSGLAFYKSYPAAEYGNEIALNRQNENVQGSVFFKASNFLHNASVTDYLKSNTFKYKALPPVMDWKSMTTPDPPSNLHFEKLAGERGDGLVWDAPDISGESAETFMYVVYQLDSVDQQAADLQAKNIAGISGTNYLSLLKPPGGEAGQYFSVASLSRNYIESSLSNVIDVQFIMPEKTVLDFPADGAAEQPEDVLLRWRNADHSTLSQLEISTDSAFSEIFYQKEGIKDTFIVVSGFTGLTDYYWRVISSNYAGAGEVSDTWRFKTGFPIAPVLNTPAHATLNVPVTPTFSWFPAEASTSYNLQVYLGTNISVNNLQVDTMVTDTVCTITKHLLTNRIYSWRVSSSNELGFGGWSGAFGFRTTAVTGLETAVKVPLHNDLQQNYPNPFNPSTTITFSLEQKALVSIKVFDITGREVQEIVHNDYSSGVHSVIFDASDLAGGLYFYRITAQTQNGKSFTKVRKMLLIK